MTSSPGPVRLLLHDGWTLRPTRFGAGFPDRLRDLEVTASVPGCVHTDLLAAGVIEDPEIGTAEDDQHWIGRSGWAYRRELVWSPSDPGHDRVDLVCDGLDTLAQVRLNGELVASTANMHRCYRIPVAGLLRPGANELEVSFAPIGDRVDAVRAETGPLPAAYPTDYPYVRKMACNFGWDWGPKLTTAGIWRPIALESWSRARLAAVRPLVDVDGTTGRVEVRVEVERDPDGSGVLELQARIGDVRATTPVDDVAGTLVLEVPEVERWWPVGLGPQARYDLEVELLVDGARADAVRQQLGFRTVEVVEDPDELGSRWALAVNGQRVAVRGYNWIPDDVYVSSVDRDRYARRIDQAVAGNANLLRVWGGGIYESDDFYELCDERGVMVWQDFLFACAAYPETDDYVAEVEAEARDVVTRLIHHPALVLWNANNECTWGYHDWGWQEQLQGRPWGAHYYGALLPRVVGELDPTRPYLIGSPSSGDLEEPPNDDRRGVQHLWDVWNERDAVHYRDHSPGFVAEMGWCAPPTWATLRRAVPEGELLPSNPVVAHHLRAADGLTKLARGLDTHFPSVEDADDWHFLLQVVQARSQQLGVEHLRALPRCSGAVVWQLNDCWPVISWAAIDGDERLKPLWYALRRSFSPRQVTIQPDGDALAVVLVDDTLEPWRVPVVVRRVGFDGRVLAEAALDGACDPMAVAWTRLDPELAVPDDPASELLVADAGQLRATWFWSRDRDLAYPRAEMDVEVTAIDGGTQVTVEARTLVRELCLFPDRVLIDDAPPGPEVVVDDLLVTLLPGEQHRFTIHGLDAEHAEALRGPPALRCVNDLEAMTGGR